MAEKDPTTMGRRFFTFCLLALGGIVLLQIALALLSQFWGWLLLIAVAIASIWLLVRLLRAHGDRW